MFYMLLVPLNVIRFSTYLDDSDTVCRFMKVRDGRNECALFIKIKQAEQRKTPSDNVVGFSV